MDDEDEFRVVSDGPQLRAEEDLAHRVLVVTRKREHFDSPDHLERAYGDIFRARRGKPGSWALLLDSRQAPGANDPETEQRLNRLSDEAEKLFDVVVILIASAAGMLQGQRLQAQKAEGPKRPQSAPSRTVRKKIYITRDVDEALRIARRVSERP